MDLPYRPADRNATQDFFAFLEPQRDRGSPTWCWRKSSLESRRRHILSARGRLVDERSDDGAARHRCDGKDLRFEFHLAPPLLKAAE